MAPFELNNIIVQAISWPLLVEKKISVDVLRLDLIHPIISGNKWFKLRYYLEDAKRSGKKTIVTWGGAWSNHILATAAACNIHELRSIGLIRGEENDSYSPTLQQAKQLGMQILFIDRKNYSNNNIPAELSDPSYYFINEGGYGEKGMQGAATILDHCSKEKYSHVCAALGTGTMIAGLVKSVEPRQPVIAVSVLKNYSEAEEKIITLAGRQPNLHIVHDYHFGGYAKYKPELVRFMNEFYRLTNIPSDFVYTGKLFYAVTALTGKDFFSPGSNVLVIHSGGLQGNASLEKGTLIF